MSSGVAYALEVMVTSGLVSDTTSSLENVKLMLTILWL
jgi:hypothetical protein